MVLPINYADNTDDDDNGGGVGDSVCIFCNGLGTRQTTRSHVIQVNDVGGYDAMIAVRGSSAMSGEFP